MKKQIKRILFTVFVIAWMIIIFSFSAKEADASSQMSLRVGRTVCNIFVPGYEKMSLEEQTKLAEKIDHPVRKCAHATEYAVLGVLLMWMFGAYMGTAAKRIGYALSIAFLYACSDEFHQRFVPGRSCQFKDVMIDTGGACVGILLCVVCGILVRTWSIRRKKHE